MKKVFSLVIVLAMLLSFAALAEDGHTYYYVAPGQGQAYCYDMHLGFKWAAQQFGCTIIAQGADDWNSETTCQTLESVVSQKPDGIITVAWDAAMNPGILKAQEAGIPIILVEAESGELGDLYIGLDNVDAGRETAEQLIGFAGEEGRYRCDTMSALFDEVAGTVKKAVPGIELRLSRLGDPGRHGRRVRG